MNRVRSSVSKVNMNKKYLYIFLILGLVYLSILSIFPYKKIHGEIQINKGSMLEKPSGVKVYLLPYSMAEFEHRFKLFYSREIRKYNYELVDSVCKIFNLKKIFMLNLFSVNNLSESSKAQKLENTECNYDSSITEGLLEFLEMIAFEFGMKIKVQKFFSKLDKLESFVNKNSKEIIYTDADGSFLLQISSGNSVIFSRFTKKDSSTEDIYWLEEVKFGQDRVKLQYPKRYLFIEKLPLPIMKVGFNSQSNRN